MPTITTYLPPTTHPRVERCDRLTSHKFLTGDRQPLAVPPQGQLTYNSLWSLYYALLWYTGTFCKPR